MILKDNLKKVSTSENNTDPVWSTASTNYVEHIQWVRVYVHRNWIQCNSN